MNTVTLQELKKDAKAGWTLIAVILLVLAGVLFLQSRAFNSSLWVLLQFAYENWQDYLWHILRSLVVWAGMTGVIFAMEFASNPANTDSKRLFKSLFTGFMTGFTFPYFLVFGLGLLIFIPLGLLSLFIEDIVIYATLEFAWLTAAYIIFLWIAMDTPMLLLEGIANGSWTVKLLAGTLLLLLVVQVLQALLSIWRIILESCRWMHRMDAGLLTVFGSLVVTVFVSRKTLGRQPAGIMILTVIGVYIVSVATGNLSQLVFDWGEMPTALVAAFVGPVVYSQAAKAILRHGVGSVFVMFTVLAGMLMGLFFAHYGKLAIIGQGWFGILCGTSIAIGFGIAFGGLWAQTLVKVLVMRTRLKPEIAMGMGVGLFLGIVLGMVLGGFLAR